MMAAEPRIIVIHAKTDDALRALVPPILQVCSESRAVGLKHYTLAFGSQPYMQWITDATGSTKVIEESDIPGRIYVNFERDTLYFREDWNEGVEGPCSCILQFPSQFSYDDLKRVKRVGFDVNARVCCLGVSGEDCHSPTFKCWDALETLYFGFEGMGLGNDCQIGFRELEMKDYSALMRQYRKNPCWRDMKLWQDDVEAVEQLRADVPMTYHGEWREKPDRFLEKLELVSIIQL
jgi:hypothetical protein